MQVSIPAQAVMLATADGREHGERHQVGLVGRVLAVVRNEVEETLLFEPEEMGVKPALLALLFRDGQLVLLLVVPSNSQTFGLSDLCFSCHSPSRRASKPRPSRCRTD